jgi:uracil-DNA glycosylase
MIINIGEHLLEFIQVKNILINKIQLPDIETDTEKIKVIMINEVPPENPDDYFYSKGASPDFMKTTLGLFHNANVSVDNINDIVDMGIYITTAVKSQKTGYTVDTEKIIEHLPILEEEIRMFPNLAVVMLMGDVAKKAFNLIAKRSTGSNCIPSGSTYKIRENEFYYGSIRVFPSYIMTGGNILIEKSKCTMISDDIEKMIKLI